MSPRSIPILFSASLACLASALMAGNSKVRINEILAGTYGDSGLQFVKLAVLDETHKQWGPQGADAVNSSSTTTKEIPPGVSSSLMTRL